MLVDPGPGPGAAPHVVEPDAPGRPAARGRLPSALAVGQPGREHQGRRLREHAAGRTLPGHPRQQRQPDLADQLIGQATQNAGWDEIQRPGEVALVRQQVELPGRQGTNGGPRGSGR